MSAASMKISQKGVNFIKKHEGFRAKAYQDIGGLWTIGFGHLINLPEENYLLNETLTAQRGEQILRQDLGFAETAVRSNITAKISQSNYDALTSLAFNIGNGAFADSTVVKRINTYKPKEKIAEAWKWWNKVNGQVVQGLVKRRQDEVNLYFSDAVKKKDCKLSQELSYLAQFHTASTN